MQATTTQEVTATSWLLQDFTEICDRVSSVRESYITTRQCMASTVSVNTFKNRLDREWGNKSSHWTLRPTSTSTSKYTVSHKNGRQLIFVRNFVKIQRILMQLSFNDERHIWWYELYPPHIINVATLPCESRKMKNVILIQWDITKENCISCIV